MLISQTSFLDPQNRVVSAGFSDESRRYQAQNRKWGGGTGGSHFWMLHIADASHRKFVSIMFLTRKHSAITVHKVLCLLSTTLCLLSLTAAFTLPVLAWGKTASSGAPSRQSVKRHSVYHQSVDRRPLKARAQLLDFWATNCGPCRTALPSLQALHVRYPGLSVQSVVLDEGATAAQVQPILHQYGVTFPVSTSTAANARLALLYKVQLYPTLFLLDDHGRIIWSHSGALDVPTQKVLSGHIAALLVARR